MTLRSCTACPSAAGNSSLRAANAGREDSLPRLCVLLGAKPNSSSPRIKILVCTHGIEVWEPLPSLRRFALRRAHLVLAPSRYTADHVASDQNVVRERIRVLPWALDPQFEMHAVAASQMALPGEFPKGRVI